MVLLMTDETPICYQYPDASQFQSVYDQMQCEACLKDCQPEGAPGCWLAELGVSRWVTLHGPSPHCNTAQRAFWRPSVGCARWVLGHAVEGKGAPGKRDAWDAEREERERERAIADLKDLKGQLIPFLLFEKHDHDRSFAETSLKLHICPVLDLDRNFPFGCTSMLGGI